MSRAARLLALAGLSLVAACSSGEVVEPPAASPAPIVDCDPALRAAIGSAVSGQLNAFARGDFRAAYAFTSQSFRAEFDVATFQALIEEQHPILRNSETHEIGECSVAGEGATARVTIMAPNDAAEALDYVFDREADGTWLIAGAIPTGVGTEQPV